MKLLLLGNPYKASVKGFHIKMAKNCHKKSNRVFLTWAQKTFENSNFYNIYSFQNGVA